MPPKLTRLAFVAAILAATLIGAPPAHAQAPVAAASPSQARDAVAALEANHGGRLGVVAFDTGSGRRIAYRADESFPLCSTHKFLSATAILSMVDQGRMQLDQRVPYGQADLLEYAPITRKNLDAGSMTVDALCEAAIEWSDNTAGNLLLRLIGGPAGWTRYARSVGDPTSRLDRLEPELNSAIEGDPRDTTTPNAMIHDLETVLLGETLSAASRSRLQDWLMNDKMSRHLLVAGLPDGWRVGDKTGSGERGTRNDIGIILPPGAAPILVSIFYTGSGEPPSSRDQVVAETGRIIAQAFGSQ
jgi:beta-lactamase class A